MNYVRKLLAIVAVVIVTSAATADASTYWPPTREATVWEQAFSVGGDHKFPCRAYAFHTPSGLDGKWHSAMNGCRNRLVRLYAEDPEIQQSKLIACLDPGEAFPTGDFNLLVMGPAWSRC